MPRPSTAADLPAYSVSGDTLISVQLNSLAVSGKVLTAAGALLAAVEKTPGISVRQEHGTITVSKDKTPEEIAATIRVYQIDWDTNQEKYLMWAQGYSVPEDVPAYQVGNILSWARKEFPNADLYWLSDAHKAAKIREASK